MLFKDPSRRISDVWIRTLLVDQSLATCLRPWRTLVRVSWTHRGSRVLDASILYQGELGRHAPLISFRPHRPNAKGHLSSLQECL